MNRRNFFETILAGIAALFGHKYLPESEAGSIVESEAVDLGTPPIGFMYRWTLTTKDETTEYQIYVLDSNSKWVKISADEKGEQCPFSLR